eukprot:768529-Hanusia_phi.AAC.6
MKEQEEKEGEDARRKTRCRCRKEEQGREGGASTGAGGFERGKTQVPVQTSRLLVLVSPRITLTWLIRLQISAGGGGGGGGEAVRHTRRREVESSVCVRPELIDGEIGLAELEDNAGRRRGGDCEVVPEGDT